MSELLKEGVNYELFEKGYYTGGKVTGFSNAEVCALATKNYVFVLPKKDVTSYLVATRVREFNYFGDGVKPADGLKQIVATDGLTVEELEDRMKAMLGAENTDRVIGIKDLDKFKIITGLLGQARMKHKSGGGIKVLSLKGKGSMKRFKAFFEG